VYSFEGEGVELAAHTLDGERDLLRAGPPVRALEEHVLGEMRDPRDSFASS